MAQIKFDMSKQEEMRQFKALPEGWYNAKALSVEDADRDGKRRYKITFGICDGEHQGETHVEYLTWDSENPDDSKSIAQGRAAIKSLAVACGCDNTQDTQDLMGVVFKLRLNKTLGKDKKEYNNAKEFVRRESLVSASATAQQSAAPQPNGGGDKPWWESEKK